MDDKIIVIGHKNPDADAICSAIGYAAYKQSTGCPNAIPARCGELVARVRYILQKFVVPPPRLILDVSPRVRDVMSPDMAALSIHATVREALDIMEERGIRVLPALDARQRFKGFVSIFKLSRFLSGCIASTEEPLRIDTTAHQLAATLDGTFASDVSCLTQTFRIVLLTSADLKHSETSPPDDGSPVIALIPAELETIQRCPQLPKGSILLLSRHQTATSQVEGEAASLSIALLSSPHPFLETVFRLKSSSSLESMLHSKFDPIPHDTSLPEVRQRVANSPYQAFPVLDGQQRTIGILKKTDLLKKAAKKLILVDHNELSQAVDGADQAEIIEIIDHHRLGSLATQQPILFRNEPVGSTSTIVADAFFRNDVDLPKPIAGLLLAGLVSDTLNLKSPTATDQDAKILKRLEIITGLNATRFTETLFQTGSILSTLPPDKAVVADAKEFEHNGYRFSIAQIEEIGLQQFWNQEAGIRAALEQQRETGQLAFAALFITDILEQSSVMLIVGEEQVIQRINQRTIKPGVFELPGIVSRKKQLLPYLTERLDEEATEAPSQRDEPLTMV